jgi:hypothetical protein
MNVCSQHSAMRIIIPSPLAGEGSAEGRPKLTRERGRQTQRSRSWRPLSRLRYAQAPSPAAHGCAVLGERGRKANYTFARRGGFRRAAGFTRGLEAMALRCN